MKYFTLLILSYTINGEPLEARILTRSATECSSAITAADALFETIEAGAIRCVRTRIPSSSPRPKARDD